MSSESPSPKNLATPDTLRDGDVVRAAYQRRITLHSSLPVDPKFSEKYPALWSWMTFQDISEDKVKDRATVSVRVSEGQWIMSISDASMAASLVVQAPSFHEALQALDKTLGKPDAPWAPWRGKEAKLKPKPKAK